MTKKSLEFLAQVHNALLTVETKGESTITLAQCIMSLQNFIKNHNEDIIEEENQEEQ